MSEIKKNLGGDRLGSGNKMNVELHNYSRSTHDLSSVWRSTMAPGTLVPFIKKLALPGDNWEINLDADVMTYPTVGPLFASFKLQLDVFVCPIRLYQGKLHNNALGIGMQMSTVKLPLIYIKCNNLDFKKPLIDVTEKPVEFQQINQSSLFSYLGIRGVGKSTVPTVERHFNAVPYLAYWDIYKNYYANKQEEIGAVINATDTSPGYNTFSFKDANGVVIRSGNVNFFNKTNEDPLKENLSSMEFRGLTVDINDVSFGVVINGITVTINSQVLFKNIQHTSVSGIPTVILNDINYVVTDFKYFRYNSDNNSVNVVTFPLSNLDDMRNDLLLDAKKTTPYIIKDSTYAPYGLPLVRNSKNEIKAINNLEGLGLKTYQSDIFNNWLSTEWLENSQGTGINQITAVSTEDGSFQIDALILARKVYDMLNRIAVSGGSYDDWLEAVWTHESYRRAESPIYAGGLSREVIFQEVVSNSATNDEPLGSLAGKGRLSDKKKGGYINIRFDEPSYIIGIVSLTPRLDYSQGNEWDVNLRTMDDFHKPTLDGIGFQELITDQMVFWDTISNDPSNPIFKSAGKQPAWINYMTDFNKSYGNFADTRKEMFMTLNRRYQHDNEGNITDLTTYIDPAKFNYMFADVDRSAQNFWVQIASNITARRKMSAKIMPNL